MQRHRQPPIPGGDEPVMNVYNKRRGTSMLPAYRLIVVSCGLLGGGLGCGGFPFTMATTTTMVQRLELFLLLGREDGIDRLAL